MNKLKNIIKEFIKDNLVPIIIFLIILFLFRFPVNYYIIVGGGTLEADPRVKVKNEYKSKGSFNLSYVSEMKGTLATYLLSFPLKYDRESIEVSKASSKESVDDIEFRNNLWLNSTNDNAAYVAYTYAGKKVKIGKNKIYIFAKLDKSDTDLRVGDEIESIDGETGKTLDEYRKIINSKNDGERLKLKVKHGDKEYERFAKITTIKKQKYIGVELMESKDYEFDPEIEFKFKDSEGGPSGGLMTALEIYNELTKKDITYGKNIAGTGTIDTYGTVGEIDGVKYKIRGAEENKMDAFLVPSGRNYKEAIETKKKYKLKIKVIEVKNFNDALNKLKELG